MGGGLHSFTIPFLESARNKTQKAEMVEKGSKLGHGVSELLVQRLSLLSVSP